MSTTLATVKEVAERLNVHPNWVYVRAADGRIPAFKVGTSWRFDMDEVLQAVRADGGPPTTVLGETS